LPNPRNVTGWLKFIGGKARISRMLQGWCGMRIESTVAGPESLPPLLHTHYSPTVLLAGRQSLYIPASQNPFHDTYHRDHIFHAGPGLLGDLTKSTLSFSSDIVHPDHRSHICYTTHPKVIQILSSPCPHRDRTRRLSAARWAQFAASNHRVGRHLRQNSILEELRSDRFRAGVPKS
jgi:hypothetical protein